MNSPSGKHRHPNTVDRGGRDTRRSRSWSLPRVMSYSPPGDETGYVLGFALIVATATAKMTAIVTHAYGPWWTKTEFLSP
jgi:hypothetical protein